MKKHSEDICIHKDTFLITQTKEIELKNPIVFVTYPGPGIVGPIISREMVKSLGLKEIGFFKSNVLSPVTIFSENVLKHPYLLYSNDEGTILLISIDYPIPPDSYLVLSEGLLNWIEEHFDAKYLVCLDGIPVDFKPEKPVVITAAEKEVALELKKYAVEIYDHGVVTGLSGALMSESLLRELVGIVLMTPATSKIPDPEAAISLVNVINDYFSLAIDTQPLLEEAEHIKKQLSMIAERQRSLEESQFLSKKAREGFI